MHLTISPFDIRNTHVYALTAIWLLVHVFLFYVFGVRDQFVDSQRYIVMSDYLVAHGRLSEMYQIFYAVPIMLLGVFRLLFADGILAFVVFQSVLSLLATFALYRAASRLFASDTAGLLAGLLYLLWFDCVQWNTAVMTESIAGSLICFVLWRLADFRDSFRDYATLSILVVLCMLTRPTGVLVAAGVVFLLLTWHWARLRVRPWLRFGVLSGVIVLSCVAGVLMLNEWDFTDQYERGNIVTYMDTIEGQTHYYEYLRLDVESLTMPDPDRPPFEKIVFFIWHEPLHFLKAAVLKVALLVSGLRPYFSTLHNVYTLIWVTLVYPAFYIGCRRAPDQALRNFCLAVVIFNCLLVGISTADWDNRFFMPMEPGIVLLAAGGARLLYGLLAKKFTEKTFL